MKNFPISAAAYLRMSTDDQQFSTLNQKCAIEKYALRNGFTIVRTYTDAGKSGLVLQYRDGLKELLRDVVSGNAPYQAILVYDVSRWGRFMDADESAHYEFMCKQANIPVHYCAESFANNNSLPSAIYKAMKRTMAAEYSRELSVKVSDGLRRISALGFRTTGSAGYGLRRMLVSEDGRRKQVLLQGERKSIARDRVILVPGPRAEVQHVREIFRMYAHEGMGVSAIVRNLTSRGVPFPLRGRKWNPSIISNMLRNSKYVGMNIWGRTSRPLMATRVHRIPRSSWTVKDSAFEPLIDRATFDKVQRIFGRRHSKNYRYSEEQLLLKLKHLRQRHGMLTKEIIDSAPGPTSSTYISRFGSLLRTYEMVGQNSPKALTRRSSQLRRSRQQRRDVLQRIKAVLKDRLELIHLEDAQHATLLVDNKIRVALFVCRGTKTPLGHRRWVFRVNEPEMKLISIVCLCDERLESVERMYVFPRIENSRGRKREFRIAKNDPLFSSATRLRSFDELYPAISVLWRETSPAVRWTTHESVT